MTTDILTRREVDLHTPGTIRDTLRLDWEDLAATIGVDQSTLYRRRQRESSPRPVYQSRLLQVQELAEMPQRPFAGPDLARDWLRNARPESHGGRETPLEMMRSGRIGRALTLPYLRARGAPDA